MPVSAETRVEVSHKGDILPRTIEAAVDKVKGTAEKCRERVGHIEVRLTVEANPTRERPAIAEATIDVDGKPIRAHISAPSIEEAIDLLVERLSRRIRRHEQQRHQLSKRRRTGDSGPGKWRHGDIPTARTEYLPVPFDERDVRRHKTFASTTMSVEEAAFDLEQLDHDFYLFIDEQTGISAIVHTTEDGDLEMISADPDAYADAADCPVTFDPTKPPQLSLADAKERLEATGERYLFLRTEDGSPGQVLYRRYDGHYGLVSCG